MSQVVVALDASAEVYGEVCRGGDGPQGVGVDDMLRFGPVEVDDVEAPVAQLFEAACDVGRVVAVDGFVVVVALGQSDALAVDDVDGWDEFHCVIRNE